MKRLNSAGDVNAQVKDTLPGDESNYVITLLNIRSLSKHFIDLVHDNSLMKSHIIALTETHVLSKPMHVTDIMSIFSYGASEQL